jgi:hypothetical protein
MMKVTYFALRDFDGYRTGDIVPNAGDWPFVSGFISQGKLSAVLVATLPEELQEAVEAWEAERDENVTEVPTFIGDREEPVVADEDESDEGEETYDDLKVADLKAELDARGIEAPAGAKKSDLIDLLVADDDADGDSE